MDIDRVFWLSVRILQQGVWVLALAGLAYLLFIFHRRHRSRWSRGGLNCALILLALSGMRAVWVVGISVWIELNPGVVLGWLGSIPEEIWTVLSSLQALVGLGVALCALVIALEARREDRQVAEGGKSL